MSSRVIQNKYTGVFAFTVSTRVSRLFLVVGIALAVMVPIFIFGVPANRDLSNHFRFALPFYDAVTSGNFYPSWLAESNSGYGDPSFRFYPPALYYLLTLVRVVTGNWYVTTLITFAIISVIGSLGAYFWAKSVLPATTAVLVSFFFALAPYHLNQLYQATLLAEWAGTALLPFAFAFVERVCERNERRDVAGLSLIYALLVLTHLPLAVICSVALFVYAIARVNKHHRLLTLAQLGGGIFLGLCASATYWVTMVSELGWIGINRVDYDASVDYRNNFVLSTFSPDNLNVWWMNIILLMTLLLFAPIVFLFRRRKIFESRFNQAVIALTVLSLFMTLPISKPIWYFVSTLQQTQFPWRWLALFSLGGSLLAAAGLAKTPDAEMGISRIKRMLVVGAIAAAVTFTFSHVVREANFFSKGQFETALNEVRGTASINYWFPIWANSNPRAMSSRTEARDRQVRINSWEPEHRNFSVEAGTVREVRVQTFYYPHWRATSGASVLSTRPDKDGALLISVPTDRTTVDLNFREPLRSRLSSGASVAGFLFMGILVLPTFGRRKTMSSAAVTENNFHSAQLSSAWPRQLCVSERQQQEHYDNIAAEYEEHYSDEWSVAYRRQFIYEPMFAGLNLSGMKVLDAMCGSGQTTEYLLERGAEVTGLDISNEVIDTFKARWKDAKAVKRSLLDSGLPDNSFDCVVIVGGLHHIHPNVNRAVQEVHRVLKPGGHLCFMEPHSGSLPDLVRRVWYKFDGFFSDNEESVNISALQKDFKTHFTMKKTNYLGNLAFLLVLNSLIFRVPVGAKKFYSPLLMRLESTINKVQSKLTSCFVVAQFQKH